MSPLPINRRRPALARRQILQQAFFVFPALDIIMATQSYERVATIRYRYRAVKSGFTAESDVDDGGLAIDCAGIWRRIAAGIGGDLCFLPWSSAPATAPPA
jgi:hypothetical protein